METNAAPLKIAVIGGGISGIVAAYILSRRHKVTLFEAAPYLGGHTNTFRVTDGVDAGKTIDTGFIVCNPVNYPNFYRFLDLLGVKRQNAEMSFGFHDLNTKFSYNGPTLKDFLVAPENLFQKNFLRMLREQRRFNRSALRDLKTGRITAQTLGDYCKELSASHFFIDNYIVPLAAAIWSSPDANITEFPALTFLRFFDNHGMLDLSRLPQWQTIVGGSCSYIEAFAKSFSGAIRLNSPVIRVKRTPSDVGVTTADGAEEQFDAAVLAAHADQTLSMLNDAAEDERSLLGAWRYQTNRTVLHTDAGIMPRKKRLWASWNYIRNAAAADSAPVAVTYYMNKLQRLKTAQNYFVTLNDSARIDRKKMLYEIDYTHPVYTANAVQSQDKIRALNGKNRTYFCGSYLGYGFHEDGVSSALAVTRHFGLSL